LESLGLDGELVFELDCTGLETLVSTAVHNRNVGLASDLSLHALAAQGSGKQIQKTAKDLMKPTKGSVSAVEAKQSGQKTGSDFMRDFNLSPKTRPR